MRAKLVTTTRNFTVPEPCNWKFHKKQVRLTPSPFHNLQHHLPPRSASSSLHTGQTILLYGFPKLKHSLSHAESRKKLTKYAHVVGSLQPEVAQEVRDLLINPPAENPYTQLKSELVKRTSTSKQQRLHQLLNAEQLGDRKQTQLLRRMQQFLGETQLEPSIMTQLFLQRLPTNAQLILASSKDTLDTESLAKLADKILEVAPTHFTAPTLSTVAPS